MGTVEHATAPRAGRACPACHQRLPEEITRYKTMGVIVPVWRPGSCHNPDCPKTRAEKEGREDRAKPNPLGSLHRLRRSS